MVCKGSKNLWDPLLIIGYYVTLLIILGGQAPLRLLTLCFRILQTARQAMI